MKALTNKTDVSFLDSLIFRIAKQSPGYSIAVLAPALASFLLLPVFSHYITPAKYGIYALLQVVTMIFGVLTSLGIPAIVPFYYTEELDKEMRRRKLGNLLIWGTVINVTVFSVLVAGGSPLFKLAFPSIQFFPYIFIILAQSLISPYVEIPIATWRIRENATMVSRLVILKVGLVSAFQFFLIVVMGWSLLGLIIGSLTGTILSGAVFMCLIRGELAFWLSWTELKSALRLGMPAIPNNLFTNIYKFADRVILERFVSHDSIGLYYLALKFGDLVKMGIDVFAQAWMPIFYKEGVRHEKIPDLMRIVTLGVMTFGIGALLVYFFAEIYITKAMHKSFHGALYLVPFVVVAQMLRGSYLFPHLAIWLAKKTHYLPLITLAPMLASIGLNLYFIPMYGVYGAATVMIFSYLVHTLLTYIVGQKTFHLPYEYPKIVVVTCFAAFLLFLDAVYFQHNEVVIRFLVSAGLYAAGAMFLAMPLLRARGSL